MMLMMIILCHRYSKNSIFYFILQEGNNIATGHSELCWNLFYKLTLDTRVYRVYTTLSMNTAIINIKTEISTKKQAQQVASKLGLSLSALINAYLKEVIKTKRVEFSLDETPSPYLIKVLRQARKNSQAY